MRNRQGKLPRPNHGTYLLLIIIAAFVFLSIKTGGTFSTGKNLRDLMTGTATNAIMAAGVLVVLITGGIDISFTATAAVVQYIAGWFLLHFAGANLPEVLLLGTAVGLALGLVNGIVIHRLRVPAIIVTIATMNIYYGLLIWISGGKLLNQFPAWFSTKTTFSTGVLPMLLVLAVFAVTALILNHSRMGRYIFAVGGNQVAARRMGVSTLKVHLFVYGYLGVLAAVAGLLQMYLTQTVAPNTVYGNEMEVLAMVVLGGAALSGGKGSAVSTLLGVLLIAMVDNGMVLLGISSYWFDFVTGLIILLSFCASGYAAGKRPERRAAHGPAQS